MRVALWTKQIIAARTTPQEARARILAAFSAQLDRMIPGDESVPLKGAIRRAEGPPAAGRTDFEDQAESLGRRRYPRFWRSVRR